MPMNPMFGWIPENNGTVPAPPKAEQKKQYSEKLAVYHFAVFIVFKETFLSGCAPKVFLEPLGLFPTNSVPFWTEPKR